MEFSLVLVMRKIFGLKRDEVTGGWRKLVLFTKYKLDDQVKEDEIGRACSMNGVKKHAFKISVGKPEGVDL
jgi:hypothetical protein